MAMKTSNINNGSAPAAKRTARIVVLPGDGIGPEVVRQAQRVLQVVIDKRGAGLNLALQFEEHPFGGGAIDAHGIPLPEATRKACKSADAILFGAVGGPQWPRPVDPNDASKGMTPRPEQGLLQLRKELGLYANIRPVMFPSESLVDRSPLRADVVRGASFVVLRELIGGIYFGKRQEENAEGQAYDTMEYSVAEVQRIARLAGRMAMQHQPPLAVHSIDKANVLATSRLWRRVVSETFAAEFSRVPLDHILVDAASMYMVRDPRALNGIVLTENLFGDILSDEASVIPGSLGLLPSASLSGMPSTDATTFTNGLYEPIHGSAPDIAGKGVANPIGTILSAAMLLRYSLGLENEAEAVERAVRKVLDDEEELAGCGLRTADLGGKATTEQVGDKVVECLQPLLDGLNAASTVRVARPLLLARPEGRRPMTMCEKILTHAAIQLPAPGNVKPGDMICVSVDWTLASELTWKGMEKTYDAMGRPAIFRNDRFWLAIDHTVDPRINHMKKPRELISASAQFAKEANLVDFYRPNYTILHTEFYRERAQPGQVIIGADSHSCSAGAVGAFAVGLGAADVVMPMVTGETWFKVPDTVEIRFINEPPFGIGGKDVILYVLGELKRNTVAFERAVEFTGPGLRYLSCDARFAISNMTTEFGGIAGVFLADEVTAAFIAKRKDPAHRSSPLYFRPDPDAHYIESHTIDLSKVDSLVALYPSPDNVKPVGETVGMSLDGVFIGACTTAEEDLILAALVLEQGLKRGLVPTVNGKRRVTPGSVPILAQLRRLGLLAVYEAAGFEIGAPGCSYCLGVAADRANEGEVWLSSQNRNFRNRMGKGSIANLGSAATVAASSFEMKVTDPRDLLSSIDRQRYQRMLDIWMDKAQPVVVSEPNPLLREEGGAEGQQQQQQQAGGAMAELPPSVSGTIAGKVQRFEDNIDTDAIIPAQFMPGESDEDLGTHAFQHVRPVFVDKVKAGWTIVVAGIGFGSGSSREEAPRALSGAGIKAVIAKSYAYIYSRNQPNMSLLGITLTDDKFYELAVEDATVTIDVPRRVVCCEGCEFPFALSEMEERLIGGGGVTEMYRRYGKQIFRAAMKAASGAGVSADLSNRGDSSCAMENSAGDDSHTGSGGPEGDKPCHDSSQQVLNW